MAKGSGVQYSRGQSIGREQPWGQRSELGQVRCVLMKLFGRYWGYASLAVLLCVWASPGVRPGLIVLVSAAVTFYFLFQACGVERSPAMRRCAVEMPRAC